MRTIFANGGRLFAIFAVLDYAMPPKPGPLWIVEASRAAGCLFAVIVIAICSRLFRCYTLRSPLVRRVSP